MNALRLTCEIAVIAALLYIAAYACGFSLTKFWDRRIMPWVRRAVKRGEAKKK